MIVIDAPHFYAAVVIRGDCIVRAAPILSYMIGWDPQRVLQYAARKRWRALRVD
jgi:hypothetical protein